MSLLPVSTVRTSTPLANQRLLFQLHADQLQLQKQYDQLSSGRRVVSFSDDPVAAGRALGLYRGIDRGNQLVRNANSTNSFYQSADTALARVDAALIESRAVAVEAGQTILSDDERVALAQTIEEAIGQVFAAGNSIYRDHQVLGGFLDSGNAFEYDGKDIVYRGNDATGLAKLGPGTTAATNMTGSEALGSNGAIVTGDRLHSAIDADSRLIDLREGRGVSAGVIRLSGGENWTDVDLGSASTIGDVVELLSAVEIDGRQIAASLTLDGIRIEYADGLPGTLAVADTAGSSTARDLAISNPDGMIAPPLMGSGLSPNVTSATKIASLNAGSGIDLSNGIQIKQGDRTFEIELADAETVGDVLIAINRSGADVRAELDPSDGRIVLRALRSGVDYSIGENGGNAASELGIRSATEETLLSSLGHGQGLALNPDGPDLVIDRPDGVSLEIELEGANTIEDVLERIRNHPLNQDTSRVLADLADVGNGLRLQAPPGAAPLTVRQSGVSNAGVRLGLIPEGSSENVGSVTGGADTITGADYAAREAGGALDTLLRLQRAVVAGDIPGIGRLQARLDDDLDRASQSRGQIGVWTNHLEQMKSVAEESVIRMQSQLSDEIDADLATVISDLSQRQAAIEASMRVIGQTAQLTVLNFL